MNQYAREGIAIIGLQGRFPGANDLEAYWRNLSEGVESIHFLNGEELRADGEDPARLADPDYVRAAGVLDGIELFDAEFFGLGRGEARSMDPQQRLGLEAAWSVVENAGYDPANCGGTVGVFAGSSINSYLLENLERGRLRRPSQDELVCLLGNDKDFLATRISYHLDLEGPSFAIQSGCSTALVAVVQAAQALSSFQCDMAIAGGVSVHVPAMRGYKHVPDGILSPDGHCRPFDARAAGTVFGSGVGLVLLKRLDEALADGDTIHAVLRGFAVNNDGARKVGFTAPSVERQAAVIAQALAMAEVEADTIGMVEAHGTATALGDPVEVAALHMAFGGASRKDSCALGSVKGNIGHLDTASGAAGLLKSVLALKHGVVPPTLHFERANPEIDFAAGPFFIPRTATPWPRADGPRRAGVSSFGVGGTNAHVVVEEAPPRAPRDAASAPPRPCELLVLSARTPAALERQRSDLATCLGREDAPSIRDAAFTLQAGRRAFVHRYALVCSSREGALRGLKRNEDAPGSDHAGGLRARASDRAAVAFLFPGQGSQRVNMGRELYQHEPCFRGQVDYACAVLEESLGFDLRTVLYPSEGDASAADLKLGETALAQPALFVVEYALTQLWLQWGLQPQALLGHSLGELVAATIAEVFALEDALRIVALRGRLVQECPRGAMIAVASEAANLGSLLGTGVELAAVNAPASCTLSVRLEQLDSLEHELQREGIAHRRLDVSHAFHSSALEPVLERYENALAAVEMKEPRIRFVSNVTGTWITAAEATDPAYWARQLRQTVQFSAGVRTLGEGESLQLLEVGPGAVLSGLASQVPSEERGTGRSFAFPSLPRERGEASELESMLTALGRLWGAGVPVSWEGFQGDREHYRVPLPTYPFERTRHWLDEPSEAPTPTPAVSDDVASWIHTPAWRHVEAAGGSFLSLVPRSHWVLLTAEEERWAGLAQALSEAGHEVSVVGHVQRHALLELLGQTARGGLPLQVALLRPAALERAGDASESRSDFELLVSIAKRLAQLESPQDSDSRGGVGPDKRHGLLVCTAGAQDVLGDGQRPLDAIFTGACAALRQEFPGVDLRCLDMDPGPTTVEANRVAEALAFAAKATGIGPHTVLRRGRLLQRDFAASGAQSGSTRSGLRAGGTYLLSGGLGGIGLTLAEHLARAHGAKLVLFGRQGLPARELWPSCLEGEQGLDAATLGVLRRIHALEQAGTELLVLRGDVSKTDDVRKVVAATRERFGAITGVIHAAGVPGVGLESIFTSELDDHLGPNQDMVSAGAHSALDAKVDGTLNLGDAVGDEPELFVLCSGLASVIGGLGQADYCAANAFMDAWAETRRGSAGPRWVAIGWDTWSETGMAAAAEVPAALEARKRELLRSGLTNVEGLAVFERVLASSEGHALISKTPLEARLREADGSTHPRRDPEDPQRAEHALASTAPQAGQPESTESGSQSQPPQGDFQPSGEIEQSVHALWKQLLAVDSAWPQDSFFDAGGNSLLATQLLARLRERFPGADVSLRKFFDAPTLAALIENIEQSHGEVASSTAAPFGGVAGGASKAAERKRPILALPSEERASALLELLRAEVGRALGLPAESVDPAARFDEEDQVLLAAHLTEVLREELDLKLYPHEVRSHPSIPDLARHLEGELAHQARRAHFPASAAVPLPPGARTAPPPRANGRPGSSGMVFLLSPPRSGSTLLRLMLSAHPRLLCPPELFLLDHEDMKSWSEDPFAELYRDGFTRALMTARGLTYDEAAAFASELVSRAADVQEAYAALQVPAQSGARPLLVDKTPTYALNRESLERAERLFDRPMFIVLSRHPYSVIDSFVRNRLDRIRRVEGDPYDIAEDVWGKAHQNLQVLARRVEPERVHAVRYEELVRSPEPVLRAVCLFLGVEYDDAVLDPYGRGRMFGGPGDPNLFERGAVDPRLADAWREVALPRPLRAASKELASDLGYELPS